MRIDHLHLENYRKFRTQEIGLDPHFTLLVGENGCGKTSVLDALAVAASIWLVEVPDSSLSNSGRNILPSEIRLDPQIKGDRTQFQEKRPVVVRATGQIGDHEGVTWTRQIRAKGRRTTNAEAKKALDVIRGIYERDSAGENVLSPVLAYYGAGRAWLPSNQRLPKSRGYGPARRWAAFYDCFNERIRFEELHGWFSRETIERGNRGGQWRPGFEAVRRAVLNCVPGADDIWFDTDRNQIVLSIENNPQPFDNLSAGQRVLLALVADVAIKAITQNAFLLPEDELRDEAGSVPRVLWESPGVVLIDEVDVHLHPSWQRRVSSDLQRTFPGIQFVCTSHSPQVIGEVGRNQIRILRAGNADIPSVAYGSDSNWILEHVMDSSERADPAQSLIEAVENALEEGDLEVARRKVSDLENMVGSEDGEVVRLESCIRNMEALAHEDD